jgi:hypothetical protein
MFKKFSVLVMTGFVTLVTATFSYAGYSFVGHGYEFPFFQLGMLIIGGLIILSLKRKYDKMLLVESVGSFALYAILVSLFTAPVIDAVKVMFFA